MGIERASPAKTSAGNMSGRSVVLQRKLQELETELASVFRDDKRKPPHSCLEMPFDDIKQRFSFLGKLLAAEVESQPEISDQLQEIGDRLAQLKADFHDWTRPRSCIFSNPEDMLSPLCDDDAVEAGDEPEEAKEEFSEQRPPERVLKKDEREGSKMVMYCGAFGCGMIFGAIAISAAVNLLVIGYEDFHLPPPT